MPGNFTLFTNDSGSASSALTYVQDVFDDVSLPATNNTGFSSTISSNPLGAAFANNDSPLYSVKTLFIKDLVLIEDRSKWINGKITYQIIWNEDFPPALGYFFGNVQFEKVNNQTFIRIKTTNDGFGLTGVFRRVQFLVNPSTSATATAQVVVDGANGNTIDFSSYASEGNIGSKLVKQTGYVHSASNETNDLHDYRLTANQDNTLRMVGVVVYYENASANISCFPGSTYVNKNKVTSSGITQAALPDFGSTVGGRALIYKNNSAGYSVITNGPSFIQSIATGSNGSANLSLTNGTGQLFPTGSLFNTFGSAGASAFVGFVQSISTDTLTVNPLLPFGVSGPIYKMANVGPTFVISQSLYIMTQSIGYTQFFSQYIGATNVFTDQYGKYSIQFNGLGFTSLIAQSDQTGFGVYKGLFFQGGANNNINVNGYFSAAEVEFVGFSSLNNIRATLSLNGIPCFSVNETITTTVKKTIFTDAGPGWNSFLLNFGASNSILGIKSINLYENRKNIGISYGALAEFDTLQGFIPRGGISATTSAFGTYRRVYGDALYLKGTWGRQQGATYTGAVRYKASTTSESFRFEYFGKNIGFIGSAAAGTTVAIDGAGVPLANIFNVMNSVATEGFHTVSLTVANGATVVIEALDYSRSTGELINDQNYFPIAALKKTPERGYINEILLGTPTNAITNANVLTFAVILKQSGVNIYTMDGTFGDTIEIVEPGMYYVKCGANNNASATTYGGVTVNSTQLGNGPQNITDGSLVCITYNGGGNVVTEGSAAIYLNIGDIVRAQHTSITFGTQNVNTFFSVVQVK